MILKKIFQLLVLTLLASCAYNKSFLNGFKVPTGKEKVTLRDTIVTYFNGENHQPTLTIKSKDTIQFSYTIESVMFNSTSGHKINGWFLKPKNKTSKITLLHFHGQGGLLLSHFETIAPMVAQGCQVFMFDYSGFGFSEGNAERKYVLQDGHSALDYLLTRPEIKNTKLVIYGQSFGGHLATIVGTQRQNEIDGMVIEGAFSSHKDIAAKSAGIFGRIFVREMYSAKKEVKKFKKPLLVIHSSEDKIIPFKMGKKLFDNANQPKVFFEIKNVHVGGPTYYGAEIYEKMLKMAN